jgi:uncharacterized repeat protein (TIGR01451 family)
VAMGDFDGDGKADLAVANYYANNVSVLRGNGDGTFRAANNYGAGTGPYSVAVGDFNGDGGADLAVANQNGSNVSVLLGVAVVLPDLAVTKTHSGSFTQGQTSGAAYTITVVNLGTAATSGTVTVTDALPTGLTATAISGTGWTCTLSPLSCSRTDALAASASYPAITLTVSVASNAPSSVTNTATVSGGGETNTANDTASDATAIIQVTGFALGANLLINPDAEDGPAAPTGYELVSVPGWTLSSNFTVLAYGTSGFPSMTDMGPSSRGTRLFSGGPANTYSSARQVVDLSAGAAEIDSGTLAYLLSGYFGGSASQSDNALLSAMFKDAGGNFLGSTQAGGITNVDRGNLTGTMQRTVAGLLPVGTRTIEVMLEMTGVSGPYNDGYADNLAFGVHHAFKVGDVFPYTGYGVGQFGDGQLNNVDLVQLFRAVTAAITPPPVCSDCFAAMDTHPVDSSTSVGGNGVLDNMDLIVSLDRVVGLDTARPIRPGRILACTARSAPELMAGTGRGGTAAWAVDGQLELGQPIAVSAGTWRVPMKLVAHVNLDLVGLSYSVTLPGYTGTLRFVVGNAGPPSLLDSGIPGTLAAGWLKGLKVSAGSELILGYVEISGLNEQPQLRVNGVVANASGSGKTVPIGFSQPAARQLELQ